MAISQLRSRIQELRSGFTVQSDLKQNIALLNNIVQMLIFESTSAAPDDHGWQIHLEAALTYFDKILRDLDPYHASKWCSILDCLGSFAPTESREIHVTQYPR